MLFVGRRHKKCHYTPKSVKSFPTPVNFAIFAVMLFVACVFLPLLVGGFRVSIDPNSYSVSGVSSGGFMAVQLEVAYSEFFIGSGIVAGGPYWCANFDLAAAFELCFKHPELVNVDWLEAETYSLEALLLIDPLRNLKTHRVYVFDGTDDTFVNPISGTKVSKQLQDFGVEALMHVSNIPAEHGWVTTNYGLKCNEFGPPYIVQCGYDMSGDMLSFIYNTELKPPVKNDSQLIENIFTFDQKQFKGSLMTQPAYAYIPTACQTGTVECKLHVLLHGCKSDVTAIGRVYTEFTGTNRWAEENNIVVVYPQVEKSDTIPFNPQGCWDWWGYSGPHYAVRDGSQMMAVKSICEKFHTFDFEKKQK